MEEPKTERIKTEKQIFFENWIRKNIKLTCFRFIGERDCTECFKPKHKNKQPYDCNSFGKLEFCDRDNEVAEFVRVNCDASKIVLELMLEQWKLHKPKLLISFVGGTGNLFMNAHAKKNFDKGIQNITSLTDTWVVTGGTHKTTIPQIGDAIKERKDTTSKVPVIGVAAWNRIQFRKELLELRNDLPVNYKYKLNGTPDGQDEFLYPNHTHFLCVDTDDMATRKPEIQFRYELEREIISKIKNIKKKTAKTTIWGNGDNANTDFSSVLLKHAVLLVVQGGLEVLLDITKAIEQQIPVVLIEGFGDMTDILAAAIKHKNKNNEQSQQIPMSIMQQFFKFLKKKMHNELEEEAINSNNFPGENHQRNQNHNTHGNKTKSTQRTPNRYADSTNNVMQVGLASEKCSLKNPTDGNAFKNTEQNQEKTDYIEEFKNIVSKNHLITVYDLNSTETSTEGFGTTIYRLLTGEDVQSIETKVVERRLKLSIKWRNLSLAQTILENNEVDKEKLDIDYLIIRATCERFVPLIRLLFKHKFRLKKNLTQTDIDKLYVRKDKNEDKHIFDPYDIKLYDQLETSGCNMPYKKPTSGRLVCKERTDIDDSGSGLKHLFVWSLLYRCQDLAVIFWTALDEPIAAALWVTKIYKTLLSSMKDKDPGTIESIDDCIEKFETLAIGVLYHCYEKDPRLCVDILRRKLDFWGGKSCVTLAAQTDSKRFIAHRACQGLLDDIWKDRQSLKKEELNCCTRFMKRIAPRWIFVRNMISYVILLGIFSYHMLIRFNPTFTIYDGLICFWIFTLAIQEVVEICDEEPLPGKSKLGAHLEHNWNRVDMVTLVTFGIGIILRAIPIEACFEVARVILCINLIMFFVRILQVFAMYKTLGPKLIMIYKMIMKDLLPYMLIMSVFILTYAVASEAILYPNTQLTWRSFFHLPRKAFWQIFGELFLDDIEGNNQCSTDPAVYGDNNQLRCPADIGTYVAPVLLGCYILVSNVLMLNILIAMFSNTFKLVHDNIYRFWCIQRFHLVYEYCSRPCLPPPLSIIGHMYRLFVYLNDTTDPSNQNECRKSCFGKQGTVLVVNVGSEQKNMCSNAEKSKTEITLIHFEADPQGLLYGQSTQDPEKVKRQGASDSSGSYDIFLRRIESLERKQDTLEEKVDMLHGQMANTNIILYDINEQLKSKPQRKPVSSICSGYCVCPSLSSYPYRPLLNDLALRQKRKRSSIY